MTDRVVARMQNRRGNRINLPQPLEPAELGWCLDTKQLFIGLNEEYAVPAIEVFPGTGNEAAAQTIVDTKITEFITPLIRLNTGEEAALANIKALPASAFFSGTSRTYLDQQEANLYALSSINNTIASSNIWFYPYITTYDWTQRANSAATASITQGGGLINSVTLIQGGVGYSKAPIVTVTDGGPGINANVTATVNGGGILEVQIAGAGSGYSVNDVITLSGGQTSAQLTVTATGGGGSITSVRISTVGTGYDVTDTGLTASGGTGSSATFNVLMTSYGSVTGFNIANAGSGYTSPAISIATPVTPVNKTTTLYKFTYHIGIEERDNGISISNVDFESFMTSLSLNPLIISPGELGDNTTGPNTGKLKTFSGMAMMMPTPRQAAHVAGLINRIHSATDASVARGLVNTKQNVEITTELSVENISDFFIENPLEYQLPSSTPFTQILNDVLSPYNDLPLEYLATENDVQVLEYSLFANEGSGATMVRTGKVRVLTLNNGVDDVATVDDDYLENRGSLITPVSSSGPDFDFKASFNNVTKKIQIQYRHSFTNRVVLKLTTRRWYSF